MTENEKYIFDLRGVIVVPNALSAEQVAKMNALMDEQFEKECEPDTHTYRFGDLLHWGEVYQNLIDNPAVVPFLVELLGPTFRLDHDYAEIMRPGSGPLGRTLHAARFPFDPTQYFNFHQGHMRNGLTVVAYNLKDVNPGDGGFRCVPGSHKSNYPFPEEWRSSDNMQPVVETITGSAGSAVIFTEALTHGTMSWNGKDDRRTIFYKYSPHSISWSSEYYNANDFPGLTERQCDILEPPNQRHSNRKDPQGIIRKNKF